MNETTEQAAIREVFEETNVSTSIEKLLYHHIYEDESERFYYLCRYISGEPMLGDGPEKQKMTQENLYVPLWVSLSDLSSTLVYPLEIRDSILEDLKNNFANTPRVEQVIFKNLRQAE